MPLIVSSSFIYSNISSLQMVVQLPAKLQIIWSVSGHESEVYNLALSAVVSALNNLI